MRKIILTIFVAIISVFASKAQLDTAVNRLRTELNNTASPEKKISILKDLIDRTVLIDEEGCVNFINQAIFLAEETRDRNKMADIRLHAARAFLTQGGKQSLLDRAEAYCNDALKICKSSSGLEREEVLAQLTLVRVHRNSGRNDKAMEVSNTVIALANDLGDDSLRVSAYLGMGRNYLYKDEKLNAFKNFLIAESIADQTKHESKDWLQVVCYRNFSEFFATIGNYDKAIDYHKKITDYDLRNKHGVDLMNNTRAIGEYYRLAGQNPLAVSYIEKSIKIADSIKSFEGKVQGTLSILNAMLASREIQKGLAYLYAHPEIDSFMKTIKLEYMLDKAKGIIYAEYGKSDSALYFFKKVAPVFEQETNIYSVAQFQYEYGYILRKIGRSKEAIPYLEKAMQYSEQAKNLEGQTNIAAYLDSCYRETGDFKNALIYSGLHTKYKDSMEVLGKEKDLISMEIDAENKRKERMEKEEELALQKRHNIQYTAIVMAIIALFIILGSFGFLKVPVKWIKVLGFFSFIFFFEFIILILDQQIHHLTHGEPWKILAIKVVLIAMLVPFHHMIEKKVVDMITTQRLKREAIPEQNA